MFLLPLAVLGFLEALTLTIALCPPRAAGDSPTRGEPHFRRQTCRHFCEAAPQYQPWKYQWKVVNRTPRRLWSESNNQLLRKCRAYSVSKSRDYISHSSKSLLPLKHVHRFYNEIKSQHRKMPLRQCMKICPIIMASQVWREVPFNF